MNKTYLAYRGIGELLQRVPEPVAELGGHLAGLALSRSSEEARRMFGSHLRRVLGTGLSDAEVARWTRRAFASYARYWVEGSRLATTPASVVEQRMVLERGMEHLEESMSAGRGVILALPHVGSWEWGGAWLALRGYPMTAVAEPLEPAELYEWFAAQRRSIGLDIVPLGPEAGSRLMSTLRSGGLVGLLCDRDLTGSGVEVELFGERTTLPGGPATLALRTGARLLTAAVYSGPGRCHTGVVNPPLDTSRQGRFRDDVTRITQAVAREIEGLVRRAPEQWHLFQPNWPSDLKAP